MSSPAPVLRPWRRLAFTFEPESCSEYDVVEAIGSDRWCDLLRQVVELRGPKCEFCADDEEVALYRLWSYDDARGIRTLVDVELLCTMCAVARTPENAPGKLTPALGFHVLGHYCRINDIGAQDVFDDIDYAFAELELRNTIEWISDLGFFGRDHE